MDLLRQIRPIDVLDMMLVATFFWVVVIWLRRTRARLALAGIAILGVIYLVARGLGLQLTVWLLHGFFAVSVIILIVVFQEDLRRFFEQIAVWGLRRQPRTAPPDAVDLLVRTVARLAATRTGALLVFPGREPLDRHTRGGIALDAKLSEPLLLSLFDPHSPGHDGAVVVAGSRIARFAVHLPLSHDREQLGPGGTRHAAGLGLAERSDALCVVVSEERGTVSVAREGRLRVLRQPEELTGHLRSFLLQPEERARPWRRLGERWLETLFAVGLTVGAWVVFVPGSMVTEVDRSVPVKVENLPSGWALEQVEPREVRVTFSGRRRDIFLAGPADLEVRIDALLVQLGRRTFGVTEDSVRHPDRISVVAVDPDQIRLSVRQTSEQEPPRARK